VTRILLDQGLPLSAVAALRDAGWNVEHVSDLGMSRSSDRSILDFARAQGRTVVTLDADISRIACSRQRIRAFSDSHSSGGLER
jgi:predicted nuclease of predicted toxin-antitoxin system